MGFSALTTSRSFVEIETHSSMGSSLILLKFSMDFVTAIGEEQEVIRVLKLLLLLPWLLKVVVVMAEGKLKALLLLQMEDEEEEKVLAVVTTAIWDAVIRGIVGVMLIAPLEFLTKSNRSVVVVVELLVVGLKAPPILLLLALALVLLINVGVDSDGGDDNDDDGDVVFVVNVELTYVGGGPVAFVCLLFVIRLIGFRLMEV